MHIETAQRLMWGIDVKIIFDTKRNVGMHASSRVKYWEKTVICHTQLLFKKINGKQMVYEISGTKCSRHVCFCPCEISTAAVLCTSLACSTMFYCLIWCDEKSAHNLQREKVDKVFSFKRKKLHSRKHLYTIIAK